MFLHVARNKVKLMFSKTCNSCETFDTCERPNALRRWIITSHTGTYVVYRVEKQFKYHFKPLRNFSEL